MGEVKDLSETKVKIGLPVEDLILAIKEMGDEDREFLVENLLAATSPEYLESIEEARRDYKEGRATLHDEVFGR
ncbi:hypothetical protein LR021_04665 [Candidatus Bipolaricaulota bacterium]|nr:hypothetical protein [Candidatus Bipolaricaulota bacterium]